MTAAGQKVGIFGLLRAKAGQRFKARRGTSFLTARRRERDGVRAIKYELQ
jgi:hypothetical protein